MSVRVALVTTNAAGLSTTKLSNVFVCDATAPAGGVLAVLATATPPVGSGAGSTARLGSSYWVNVKLPVFACWSGVSEDSYSFLQSVVVSVVAQNGSTIPPVQTLPLPGSSSCVNLTSGLSAMPRQTRLQALAAFVNPAGVVSTLSSQGFTVDGIVPSCINGSAACVLPAFLTFPASMASQSTMPSKASGIILTVKLDSVSTGAPIVQCTYSLVVLPARSVNLRQYLSKLSLSCDFLLHRRMDPDTR